MAANDNRVIKMQEVTKVTALSNSTKAITLPLTYFDIFWFKIPPVERLFFYQITHLTSDEFNSVILPRLMQSLSTTLLHYLPLAGNIMWPQDAPKPAIYYFPDDGVSVTVAVSNGADFNHLSGNGIRKALDFHPLVPQLPISDDKAEVIAIQITLFPNEGYSIGISFHHAALDGKSSTMFLKSWAYLCKQLEQDQNVSSLLLPTELTPFFDRTVIKDSKGQDMVELNRWFVNTGSDSNLNKRSLKVKPMPISGDVNKLVRGTFELSRGDIKKLRDKINYEISQVKRQSEEQLHLSSFVVTLAYAFVFMVKAKTVQGNKNVIVRFAADYRSRLDPPVPQNYFGNCVGRHGEAAKASDFIQENGVAFAAEMLSGLVKGIDADIEPSNSDEMIAKLLEIIKLGGALILSVAGSTRFNVYGSDFGWGRPKKVEIVSIDRTGAVSLAESRDGDGGIEVGVVLEKQQMDVFASLFTNDGLQINIV